MNDTNFLNELNGNKSPFTFDGKSYKFVKKNELPLGQKFRVVGCYVSKGKFGFQSVIVFDDTKDFKARYSFSDNGKKSDLLTSNQSAIDTIKNGKLYVTFESYHSKKFNVDTVGMTFEVVDLPF